MKYGKIFILILGDLGQNNGTWWSDVVSIFLILLFDSIILFDRWTLDYDDYTGLFCNRGEFPFTRRVHETMFDSVLTTSTLTITNDSQIITTTIASIRSSKSSISPTFNRTNKTNFVLVVAPSHRTKIVSDSRMVNHSGDHFSKNLFYLLFFLTVFDMIK
jgi:hypothetical protein